MEEETKKEITRIANYKCGSQSKELKRLEFLAALWVADRITTDDYVRRSKKIIEG